MLMSRESRHKKELSFEYPTVGWNKLLKAVVNEQFGRFKAGNGIRSRKEMVGRFKLFPNGS